MPARSTPEPDRTPTRARRGGSSPRRLWKPSGTVAAVAAVLLVGVYGWGAPKIREATGLPLPTVRMAADGSVEMVDSATMPEPQISTPGGSEGAVAGDRATAENESSRRRTKDDASSAKRSGPLADRVRPRPRGEDDPPGDRSAETDPRTFDGYLKAVGGQRYVSPAGLMYTRGSAEGHRLEHLRRHTEDQPRRPGSHGVFDGGMTGALKTIDRAYERAKKNQRTTRKRDEGRDILTVDMGGRVGYVGGRDGNRRRKPMARRVRLVLDGRRVITAYPL